MHLRKDSFWDTWEMVKISDLATCLLVTLLVLHYSDWGECIQVGDRYRRDLSAEHNVENYEEEQPLSNWSPDLVFETGWPRFLKNKRAAFGILQLATKRPHKTASQLIHLPVPDAFMSVRGRKRSIPENPVVDLINYINRIRSQQQPLSRSRQSSDDEG